MSDLRNIDKPVGLLEVDPSEGDILITLSGRQTSPYPALKAGTPALLTKSRRAYQAWLIENTIEEARLRGDSFNLRMFESDLELLSAKKSLLPAASVDVAELYLFEAQPILFKNILNDLDKKKVTLENEVAAAKIQQDMFGESEPDFNPDVFVKIAADSWEQLREQDVMRLIKGAVENGESALDSVVTRIIGIRPDLKDEVVICLNERIDENPDIKFGQAAQSLLALSTGADQSVDDDIRLFKELGEEGLLERKEFGSIDRLRRLGLILDEKAKDAALVDRVIETLSKRDLDGSVHWLALGKIQSAKKALDKNKIEYLTINQFIANIEVGEVESVRVTKYQDELVQYRELSGALKTGRIHWKLVAGEGGSLLLANNIVNEKIAELENIITVCPLFDSQIAQSYGKNLSEKLSQMLEINVEQTSQVGSGSNQVAQSLDEEIQAEKRIKVEYKGGVAVDYSPSFSEHARRINCFVRRGAYVPKMITEMVYQDTDLQMPEVNILIDYAEGVIKDIEGWEPPSVFADMNNRDLLNGDIVLDLDSKQLFFEMDASVSERVENRFVNFSHLDKVKGWNQEIGFSHDDAVSVTEIAQEYAESLGHAVKPYHLNFAYGVHFKIPELIEFAAESENKKSLSLIEKHAGKVFEKGRKAALSGILNYCGVNEEEFNLNRLKNSMERHEAEVAKKFSNGPELIEIYKSRILNGFNTLIDEVGRDKILLNTTTNEGFNLSTRGIRFSEISTFLRSVIAWDKANIEFELKNTSTDQLYNQLVDAGFKDESKPAKEVVEDKVLGAAIELPEMYMVCEGKEWVTYLGEVKDYSFQMQSLIHDTLESSNNHVAALRVRAIMHSAPEHIQDQLKQLEKEIYKQKCLTPVLDLRKRLLSAQVDRFQYSDDDLAQRILLNITSNGRNFITNEAELQTVNDQFRLGVFKNADGHFQGVAAKQFDHGVTSPYLLKRFAVKELFDEYSTSIEAAFREEHGIPSKGRAILLLQEKVLRLGAEEYASHLSNTKVLGDAVIVKVFSKGIERFLVISPDHSSAIDPSPAEEQQLKLIWDKLSEFQKPNDSLRAVVSYETGILRMQDVQKMDVTMADLKSSAMEMRAN